MRSSDKQAQGLLDVSFLGAGQGCVRVCVCVSVCVSVCVCMRVCM